MIRALSAAAVLHGFPRLLIEDDAEKENKRTLELQKTRREYISKYDLKQSNLVSNREEEVSPAHS